MLQKITRLFKQNANRKSRIMSVVETSRLYLTHANGEVASQEKVSSVMQKAEIKIEITWFNMRRRVKEATQSITDPGRKGSKQYIKGQRKTRAQ